MPGAYRRSLPTRCHGELTIRVGVLPAAVRELTDDLEDSMVITCAPPHPIPYTVGLRPRVLSARGLLGRPSAQGRGDI